MNELISTQERRCEPLPHRLIRVSAFIVLYYLASYLLVCGFVNPASLLDTYIGSGEAVMWSNLFWWFQHAVFLLHQSPLPLSDLFFPLKIGIYDGSLPLFAFAPISRLFGSIFAYNLYVISTFAWSGAAAHGLARHLRLSTPAALLTGYLFAFSSKHFLHAGGHLHVYSTYWIPLVIWALLRFLQNPSWLRSVCLALMGACTALTSWTIALVSGILAFVLLVQYSRSRLTWTIFRRLSAASLLAVILASPGIYWLLLLRRFPEASYGFKETLHWSTDLLAYVTPPPTHRFLGSAALPLSQRFTGNAVEATAYLGVIGIVLTVIAVAWPTARRRCKSWFPALTVFLLLPLGPILHIAGASRFSDAGITITLPAAILPGLPVFDMMRTPNRYEVGTTIIIALLSGIVLQALQDKLHRRSNVRIALFLIVSALAVADSLYKVPRSAAKGTPKTYEIISQDPAPGAVVELPAIRSPLRPDGVTMMIRYYEYQKHHRRPLVGGYFARVNPAHLRFVASDPVLRYLWSTRTDIQIGAAVGDPLRYLATYLDIGFIIIHKNFLTSESLDKLCEFLGPDYRTDETVSDDPIIIYRTSQEAPLSDRTPIHLELNQGWHALEEWTGEPFRWIEAEAAVAVDVVDKQAANLDFLSRSISGSRTLVARLDGIEVAQISIAPDKWVAAKIPLLLSPGTHQLTFSVPEGTVRPCDLNPDSRDTRQIAVAIRSMTVSDIGELQTEHE